MAISRARDPGRLLLLLLAAVGVGAAGRETTLVGAAKAGDAQTVRALLKEGHRAGVAGKDGTTALHWAAYREDAALVDLLIGAGADVKPANRYGATPLSLACANGNASIVERLLNAGADANTATAGGETAVMTASRTGNVAVVQQLLAHGADVNAREPTRGQTALMWAAAEGHAGVVKALLAAGADLHATSRAPAGAAMSYGNTTYRRNVSRIDVFTPLLFAVRAGRIEATGALLEAGASVNETAPDGTSVLVIAIHNAHYEMAAFLLDKGADPNAAAQGWTALHQLLRTRNLNIGFFPHPEPHGKVSDAELARKLIAHGADVNARITKPMVDGYRNFWTQNGATPLLLAAKGADAEMMRLLAAHGADPTLTNTMGTTPLMAASGVEMFNPNEDSGTNEEAFEAVNVAVELGRFDVNQANNQGETALHGAAWRGANEIVQLLADRGAKLDVKTKRGMTPLMLANGEEERIANINVRPWTVALLQKLLRDQGLPADVKSRDEQYAVERPKPADTPRSRRNRDEPGDQTTEPVPAPPVDAPPVPAPPVDAPPVRR